MAHQLLEVRLSWPSARTPTALPRTTEAPPAVPRAARMPRVLGHHRKCLRIVCSQLDCLRVDGLGIAAAAARPAHSAPGAAYAAAWIALALAPNFSNALALRADRVERLARSNARRSSSPPRSSERLRHWRRPPGRRRHRLKRGHRFRIRSQCLKALRFCRHHTVAMRIGARRWNADMCRHSDRSSCVLQDHLQRGFVAGERLERLRMVGDAARAAGCDAKTSNARGCRSAPGSRKDCRRRPSRRLRLANSGIEQIRLARKVDERCGITADRVDRATSNAASNLASDDASASNPFAFAARFWKKSRQP